MEFTWKTNEIEKNAIIKECCRHLTFEEAKCFIKLLSALHLPLDLIALNRILLNIEQILNSVSRINFPTEISDDITLLKSLIGKVKKINCLKNLEINSHITTNPYYGRINSYPIAALFAQRLGSYENDNQKKLILLLNYLFLLILYYNNEFPYKHTNTSASIADYLRKIISSPDKFALVIPFEKITYNIFPKLLDVISVKSVGFPAKLKEEWLLFDENKPFITTKNKQARKQPPPLSLLSAKKLDYKSYISYLNQHLFFNKKQSDNDEGITELISVEPKDNLELSSSTLNAQCIYGSRLSLIEKKHLPWRSNVLTEHEIKEVVTFLHSELSKLTNPVAIITTLALLTSKSFSDILKIKIYNNTPELNEANSDFINISSKVWSRKSIKMPWSFEPATNQQEVLDEHSDWLSLPMPEILIHAIEKLKSSKKEPALIADICFDSDTLDQTDNNFISKNVSEFLNTLWTKSETLYRRITPAAIRVTLFEQLSHQFDAGYASLLLANTEYDTPTTLYYLNAKSDKLVDDYKQTIEKIGFTLDTNTSHFERQKSRMIGSELAINQEKLAKIIDLKYQKLMNLISKTPKNLNEIIAQHTEFVLYTMLMLVAATGHRSRTEFGFTSASINLIDGYIILSDKINYIDSAIRFIPIPEILQKQLINYQYFCGKVAQLLKPYSTDLSVKLAKVYKLTNNDQPMFFQIKRDKTTQNIGFHQIEEYLSSEINLPLNFLRHFFCSSLRSLEHYQYTKAMMGHIGSGEHLLSDHSCASLVDIKCVAPILDQHLKNLGFTIIEFPIPKGPQQNLDCINLKEPYFPDYMRRVEQIEQSKQIKWARQFVRPFIKQLQEPISAEQARTEIYELALNDHQCNISTNRRFYWINRILNKIIQHQSWLSPVDQTQHLHLNIECLSIMQQATLIKKRLNSWLLTNNDNLSAQQKISKIWLSLVINSGMQAPLNLHNIKVIISPSFYEQKLAFFDNLTLSNGRVKTQVIDSISMLLIQNFSTSIKNTQLKNTVEINKYLKDNALAPLQNEKSLELKAKKALEHLDNLAIYLNNARNELTPSLVHAYNNKRINTTDLPIKKVCRWLSSTPTQYEQLSEPPETEPIFSTKLFNNEQSKQYSTSLALIRKISKQLNSLKETNIAKLSLTQTLTSVWAEFVSLPHERNINKLIAASTQLDQIIVLIILWLINVSKRPGRQKRKRTALGTLTTYLSNIARPLLEQSYGQNFLLLDPDELAEIYSDALDSRSLKNRVQRAEIMRNFHNFVLKTYQCSPVNWYEVEPSIGNNQQKADANIISMREYHDSLDLLANDQYMSSNDRNINQLILILCYRAGLRSGEAKHLKLKDIDINNWIIHVRTQSTHRTKTLKSNRRIPVDLFLSDDEKALITNRISLLKNQFPNHGEDLWLFGDQTNAESLIQISTNILRVIQALRLASGDNTLRLHHARHSFANYLLLITTQLTFTSNISDEIKNWCRTPDLNSFSDEVMLQLTGKSTLKENILHAISLALGHTSPETTLRSYIHVLSLISAASREQWLFSNVDKAMIIALSKIQRTHGYKILERKKANKFGFIPLAEHCIKNYNHHQKLKSHLDNKIRELPPVHCGTSKTIKEKLNNIERITRMAEAGKFEHEITARLQLDYLFVKSTIKAAQKIILETGYAGLNIPSTLEDILFASSKQKQRTSAKYIALPSFQDLLSNLSKLSQQQMQEVTDLWSQSFSKSYGLVVAERNMDKFKNVLSLLNYQIIDHKNAITISIHPHKRTGQQVKVASINSKKTQKNDNKLNHALFLLSIYQLATNTEKEELSYRNTKRA